MFTQNPKSYKPLSFSLNKNISIPFFTLPQFDIAKLEAEDIKSTLSGNKSQRFAAVAYLDLKPDKDGLWVNISDNISIWLTGICSKDAFSLNLLIENINVPQNSGFFVYNINKDYILGPYSFQHFNITGKLPIAPVPGDSLIIEFFVATEQKHQSDFKISKAGHDYTGLIFNNLAKTKRGYADCFVNINCPEGIDWQLEKRSVCKIIYNQNKIGSGALINNTLNDGKPYLLTVNHCIPDEQTSNTAMFFFTFESTDCNSSWGNLKQSIMGAHLVATMPANRVDFALVELFQVPPPEFNPYYAGWTIDETIPEKTFHISHPDGLVKKIAIDFDPPVSASFNSLIDNCYWQILRWDIGASYFGASGGPLFNVNHQIIGCLSGGWADCDKPEEDYFTKFNFAWNYSSDKSNSLKNWLDPNNSGVKQISGFDPYNEIKNINVSLLKIISPVTKVCNIQDVTPQILILNNGSKTINNLKIKYIINNKSFNFDWNGELHYNENEIVTLNPINISDGDYNIFVELLNPNNLNDQNTIDNTLSVNFQVISGEEIKLQLVTDNYGYETQWKIIDYMGKTLYKGENYLNNKTYIEKLCLIPGYYFFTITDKNKDGICCNYGNGSYSIYNRDNDLLLEGNRFNANKTHYFELNFQRPDYDILTKEILTPKNNECNLTDFKPAVLVANLGTQTIKKLKISYQLDDNEPVSGTWNGYLLSQQEDTLIFPVLSQITEGEHNIKFSIQLEDQINELVTENNSIAKSFTFGNSTEVYFELTTDLFGSEITWQLQDSDNEIIAFGGPYRDGRIEVKERQTFCLADNQCFKFSIFDKWADGICCKNGNGNYLIINKLINDTIVNNGNFRNQEVTEFCTGNGNIVHNINNNFVDIFPNPSNNYINIVDFSMQSLVNKQIMLYNIQGQKIKEFAIFGTNNTLNISNLPDGIYFIKIQYPQNSVTKKFIKSQH